MKVLLGDVVQVNPESLYKAYQYDQIEYIDISSVGTGTLLGTTIYDLKDAPGRAKRIVRDGDTIVAMVRPNLRSFLYIKNPKPNLVVSTGFAVLRPGEKIDSRFLYYTVTDQSFTDYLVSRVRGAAYPAVDTETFKQAEINLPSLPTQRKIAAILSAYDDLIENNTRRIKILEEMAQLIYRDWFVKFRFPGHEKVRMVDSELGPIPEGWKVRAIGEVFDTLGGGTPSTKNPEYWVNGTVTWFTPSDLTSSGTMFVSECAKRITQKGLEKSSAKMFPAYSVMMTSRATIGVTAINTVPACTNQGFIVCVPNELASTYEIYYWINTNKERIEAIASGATYKEINRTEFRSFLYVIADSETRKRFNNIIEPLAKQIEGLTKKNLILRRTRDLLLPKLISGELDVEDLDIAVGGD